MLTTQAKATQTVYSAIEKNKQLWAQKNPPLLKNLQQNLFWANLKSTAGNGQIDMLALRTGLTQN